MVRDFESMGKMLTHLNNVKAKLSNTVQMCRSDVIYWSDREKLLKSWMKFSIRLSVAFVAADDGAFGVIRDEYKPS